MHIMYERMEGKAMIEYNDFLCHHLLAMMMLKLSLCKKRSHSTTC